MIRYINAKNKKTDSNLSTPPKETLPYEEIDITYGKSSKKILFENIIIRPGFKMILANHDKHESIQMSYEIEHAPISFCYTLSQRVRSTMINGTMGKRVVERSHGDSVLAYLPKTRGITKILSDRTIGVSLHFCMHRFYELFETVPRCIKELCSISGKPAEKRFYQQSRFNWESLFILKQILGCPYKGETRRLYMEAKSLELVALKLSELGQRDNAHIPSLTRKDLDRAREAYHILVTNLDNPPNLFEISRLVGTNRNKLNQCFKEIYGDTVFNVLHDVRLSKAWSLLKQTEHSLSDIALSVGYNNQTNFTTAFRRKFGKTPKTVRRDNTSDPFPPMADMKRVAKSNSCV